jgi:hypothetical protein
MGRGLQDECREGKVGESEASGFRLNCRKYVVSIRRTLDLRTTRPGQDLGIKSKNWIDFQRKLGYLDKVI